VANEYRSARRFKNPPPLFRWADAQGYFSEPADALVFGAGLLREAIELSDRDWRVDVLETRDSIERREGPYGEFAKRSGCRVITTLDEARPRYRVITATHVFEFIENTSDRDNLLRGLADRLAKSGFLLVSLRGWPDVLAAKTATPQGDGVITGIGTWTRGYSMKDALDFLSPAGLRIVAGPPGGHAKRPEQVRLICQR
jgi:hypothetical protein